MRASQSRSLNGKENMTDEESSSEEEIDQQQRHSLIKTGF